MELLWVAIAGLLLIGVPISIILLIIGYVRLRTDLNAAKSELLALNVKFAAIDKALPAADPPATTPPVADPPALPDIQEAPPEAEVPPTPRPASVPAAAPEPLATRSAPVVDEPDTPPKTFVLSAENADMLFGWLRENWFYAIAALSLTMAGVFLVQYGVEHGLLSPTARVISALVFGSAMIMAGNWVRRRGGDEAADLTAYFPSVLAGGGIVTLFAAVVAARQLYGLIGPEMAFAGLVIISIVALAFGWLFGLLLSAIGIIGSVAAPFIVGGRSDVTDWLFFYFAGIAVVGLAVDSVKRSAWLSLVALVVPYGGAVLLWLASARGTSSLLAFAAIVGIAAVCIPLRSIRPRFAGAMMFGKLHRVGEGGWPEFPTRLAAGGLIGLCAIALVVSAISVPLFWSGLGVIAAAFLVLVLRIDVADALEDLTVPLALTMLGILLVNGVFDLGVDFAQMQPVPDIYAGRPFTVTLLMGAGLAVSALAAWVSFRMTSHPVPWAFGSVLFAPAVAVILHLTWTPLAHMSPPIWALHIAAIAILMSACTGWAIHRAEVSTLRISVFCLAALNILAFALWVVLTETALTLAFGALVVSAAWLDRRFDIPWLAWFVKLGTAVSGFRLLVAPGLPWAFETAFVDLALGFLGVIALLAAARVVVGIRGRREAMVVTESACWGLGAIFASILLYRAVGGEDGARHHGVLGILATIWLISAATQLYRAQITGWLTEVRLMLGWLFGSIGVLVLMGGMTISNPLSSGDFVTGPPILDSLLMAYAMPAAVLASIAAFMRHLDRPTRRAAFGIAAVSVALYVGLEIRRLWQGVQLDLPGVSDGELYSYTVAMLLTGTVLLILAFLRRSAVLRQVAVGAIGLTIAKVFLLDMSGLSGLIRVFSFFALGLVLAGLAVLNRWMTSRMAERP